MIKKISNKQKEADRRFQQGLEFLDYKSFSRVPKGTQIIPKEGGSWEYFSNDFSDNQILICLQMMKSAYNSGKDDKQKEIILALGLNNNVKNHI